MLSNKPRILFVDKDPRLMESMNRALKGQRISWIIDVATSGKEALKRIEAEPPDALVVDMNAPGLNGSELFDIMIARHPRAIRFIHSVQKMDESFLRAILRSHRILYKPCDSDVIIDALSDALMNREFILDKGLQEIVSRIQALPHLPVIYSELSKELRNEEPSIKKVGALIGRDVGLLAKILSIVNSAYFNLSHYVTDPVQAISLIGLNVTQSLVLMLGVFAQLENKIGAFDNFSLRSFQNHSLGVAKISRAFAKSVGLEKENADLIHLAGLLHDIGWLILAAHSPFRIRNLSRAMTEKGGDCYSLEREAMGSTHAALGAYLLSLWGMPRMVVDIVACHHEPWQILNADPLSVSAVHCADSLYHLNRESPNCLYCCQLDMNYLTKKGLMRQYSSWKEMRSDMKMDEK